MTPRPPTVAAHDARAPTRGSPVSVLYAATLGAASSHAATIRWRGRRT